MSPAKFNSLLQQQATQAERPVMPWRQAPFAPYTILVSEIMLQQTQVERVIPKYQLFLQAFPDAKVLASAPLSQVLEVWQGLGYYRRAKFLHRAAAVIANEWQNIWPRTSKEVSVLPGVGLNTAGAILAYSFNQPEIFVETNVRTVIIHHFFADHPQVGDKQIAQKVNELLDKQAPREWYWAMMDYGWQLKRQGNRAHQLSAQYAKQSKFEGSWRQQRARALHYIRQHEPVDITEFKNYFNQATKLMTQLEAEEFIEINSGVIHIKL